MQKTYSSAELAPVAYYPQIDETAVVLLRDNISYVETEEGNYWQADEVSVVTTLTETEVEENFDELWVQGETASKPLEQRVAELEEINDAIIAIILGEDEE